MPTNIVPLISVMIGMIVFMAVISMVGRIYNLNRIKSKTVGDGQHGTARWATKFEEKRVYKHIPFTPRKWREQAARGETPTICHFDSPSKKAGFSNSSSKDSVDLSVQSPLRVSSSIPSLRRRAGPSFSEGSSFPQSIYLPIISSSSEVGLKGITSR